MSLSSWATKVIENVGELGVAALMALENIMPPIPSEVVLPFAGFSISQGILNPPLTWGAATGGALAGAYLLYAIGAFVSYDKLQKLSKHRWFFLFSSSDLSRGERLFDRHGSKVVLFGRCVPFLRSVVSVPAGLTRMPLWKFTALTAAGSGAWNALFLYIGYRLGNNYGQVQAWFAPIGYAVIAALLLSLVWLAIRRHRSRQHNVD